MHRILLLLIFPLLLSGAQEPLRVATWNLQNFLSQNRYEEGTFQFEYPLPEARKARIRKLLLEHRPAVLFLQELGSAGHLKELQLDLAACGLAYPYARFSAAPGSRTGLAVLSLLPPAELIYHDPVPLDDVALPGHAMQRGIQEVVVSHGARRFRFFHLHLKSRYSSNPDDPDSLLLRSAELTALSRFLDARLASDPASAFVLVGDFNTPFEDPLMQRLGAGWLPLQPADQQGHHWTYHHRRSGSREILDGFWVPGDRPSPLRPDAIAPVRNPPSDHRLVLAVTGE